MPHIINLIDKKLAEKGMSMRELSRQVGIHYQTLKASEENTIRIGTLKKIGVVLEIPMSEFFEEDKIEISEKKKYELAQSLINMAAELVPEYKKLAKAIPPKTDKQTKKGK